MGLAGRPPVLAVAVRWPAGQSESWREARAAPRPRHHRLPRWPHQPRGPARGRPAYGVDAAFTLFLQHG